MAEPWVINASPLILLAKAGLVHHVPILAQPLVIPEPVAVEVLGCRTVDAAVAWLRGSGNVFVRPPLSELAELQSTRIGLGERAVISWAVANTGFVAVMDDAEARTFAARHGVPLLGTVGIVLQLKRSKLIEVVKPHLLEIRKAGGFIGDRLFHEALRNAGEQP